MYKKLFATFLAFMLIGLNSICLVSFSHALSDSTHVGHEDMTEVACANCEQDSASSMTCCFDANEKPVSLTTYNRGLYDGHEFVSSPHVAIAQFDSAIAKERKYLALAYNPPLIRVGIVVKKE
jgi:hypothetical protein